VDAAGEQSYLSALCAETIGRYMARLCHEGCSTPCGTGGSVTCDLDLNFIAL